MEWNGNVLQIFGDGNSNFLNENHFFESDVDFSNEKMTNIY